MDVPLRSVEASLIISIDSSSICDGVNSKSYSLISLISPEKTFDVDDSRIVLIYAPTTTSEFDPIESSEVGFNSPLRSNESVSNPERVDSRLPLT